MSIVTVWENGFSLRLHQLSDDPADGTPQDQIAYLATLDAFAGCSCVCEDYSGSVPDAPPGDWRWSGSAIVTA